VRYDWLYSSMIASNALRAFIVGRNETFYCYRSHVFLLYRFYVALRPPRSRENAANLSAEDTRNLGVRTFIPLLPLTPWQPFLAVASLFVGFLWILIGVSFSCRVICVRSASALFSSFYVFFSFQGSSIELDVSAQVSPCTLSYYKSALKAKRWLIFSSPTFSFFCLWSETLFSKMNEYQFPTEIL